MFSEAANMFALSAVFSFALAAALTAPAEAQTLDVTNASVLYSDKDVSTAATVLIEEVQKRTGTVWATAKEWPAQGPAVAIALSTRKKLLARSVPHGLCPVKAEGYGIATDLSDAAKPIIWIVGADKRGALYGVGRLLRSLEWEKGSAKLAGPLNAATAPAYAIRGHQLGYRARANSYDAWDVAQYDQYIREMALFGANSVENIPFEDSSPSPVMKLPREQMNREMSAICRRYDLDYWVWTPATFDLNDAEKRSAALDEHEAFYAQCPRLDAIFFPGGDPGDNHPRLVMPFLEALSKRLAKHHPKARIWISLQGFDDEQVDYFYQWIAEHDPAWMGGVVAGPSSPSIPETRTRLPKRYGIRHYPDITHTIRAQYPTPWWDPAFAFTLGREPINPEPIRYAYVHNVFAPYTSGFLTYSDGAHDDVNKMVWSAMGWDPNADIHGVILDYARLFFGSKVAQQAADGIFALESNWRGPLAANGGVEATLALWKAVEAAAPGLSGNWRAQCCLLRAFYDAYTRDRLLYESRLEREANGAMAEGAVIGADPAMDKALAILKRAETEPVRGDRRARILELCDALFGSIGLQTSVPKYHASGSERGAVLDYVDYPLNNRWWLEDEFAKARAMKTEEEKLAQLKRLYTWENPGPGSYYDDIGNVAKSPHVIRGEDVNTDPNNDRSPNPDFMWWDEGRRRVRQSWMSKMDWPLGLRYEGVDPAADYVIQTTGMRDCFLRVNGVRVKPTVDGKEIGEIKEFPVPKRLYPNGLIVLTFDVPFEPDLNWRVQSRLNEVWLIRK